jgi:hypothetical protein
LTGNVKLVVIRNATPRRGIIGLTQTPREPFKRPERSGGPRAVLKAHGDALNL